MIGLCGHFRDQAYEARRRFFDVEFAPCAGKKKEHNTRAVERSALMWRTSDAQIFCQDCPSTFETECFNPINVGNVLGALFAQVDDLMLYKQSRQRARRGETVKR